MQIGLLTHDHVDAVFNNLSVRSIEELNHFGKTVEGRREFFHNSVGSPFAVSFFTDPFDPLIISSLEPMGNMVWRAELIAVPGAWGAAGMAVTKFLTRFSEDFVHKCGGMIEAYSPYEDSINWFETMGFRMVQAENRTFRYIKSRW